MPLELEYVDPHLRSMRDEEKQAMTTLIRRHQTRWRYLSLFIESVNFREIFFEPPPSEWASLHTLALWTYDFIAMGEDRQTAAFDALEKLLSLQCLILKHDDAYGYTRHFGPIDLPEIHLVFDAFDLGEAQLISAYSRLTKLVLVAESSSHFELPTDYRLTLTSLLSFSFDTYNLSLLHHLTTPALADLEIHLHFEGHQPQNEFFASFVSRCTSQFRSLKLNSDEEFIAKVLPSLSTQPSLTHLMLNIWPSAFETDPHSEHTDKEWCPSLRDLTVSIGLGGVVELERMKGLATFLSRREDFELPELEKLTVNRCSGAIAFPYELFDDLHLGELTVMVPWSTD
ncbi:hypothetical protein BKA70DRAFT_1447379 [Coprinopsis sp. MPI-PUGE-AT-0042]|nr:hypothetical protein BKA70DRAFT_1447379 [Coprinopsis sp. MPI-PUGE-AT-0042]